MIIKNFSASVSSTVVSGFSYNAKAGSLTVNFKSGKNYVYENVPMHVVSGMLSTDSAGQFFNRYIKNKYRFIEL